MSRIKNLKTKKYDKKYALFRDEKSYKKKRRFKLKLPSFFMFKNKKEKRKNIIKYYIMIFVVLIIIILVLILGPTFNIKKIEIIKNDSITNINLSYKALEDIRGKSLLNIDRDYIKSKIKNFQATVENIDIEIILPSTIKISIGSGTPVFNVFINNKNFLLTNNGGLIPSNAYENLETLEIKRKSNISKILDYKIVFEKKYIDKIILINQKIKDNLLSIKIDKIKYYETEREVHFTTKNNITLIFSLENDILEQAEKLIIFDKEMRKLSKGGIVYLDLRIFDKIFLCDSENENDCNASLKRIYE